MEQESDNVSLGKQLHENSYKKEKEFLFLILKKVLPPSQIWNIFSAKNLGFIKEHHHH